MAEKLPPEVLFAWWDQAAAALGVDASTDAVDTLLRMTQTVAHEVARPAAPLSSFLLGVAVGQDPEGAASLRRHADTLSELATRRGAEIQAAAVRDAGA